MASSATLYDCGLWSQQFVAACGREKHPYELNNGVTSGHIKMRCHMAAKVHLLDYLFILPLSVTSSACVQIVPFITYLPKRR